MGSHKNGFKKEGFILSVDIGTTTIRCHVYDKTANIRGSCSTKVLASRCSNSATNTQLSLCNIYINRVTVGILMLIMFLQVIPLYPKVGYVEMNPDAIWKGFISVARGAVQGMVAAFPIVSTCKRRVNCFLFCFVFFY